MVNNNSNFMYFKHNSTYIIKINGTIKYTICNEFDKFINYIFGKEKIDNIIIDLRTTNYLDSTCLGLLAKIANYLINKKDKKPTLISNNKDINRILNGVGFNKVFHIIKKYPKNIEELEEISVNDKDNLSRDMGKMILDAHKSLFNLNEKNKETFKDVVSIFQKQLKNNKKKGKDN